MTNEQAKKFANCLKNNYTIDFNDMADFCDTVIETLEQETVSKEVYDNEHFARKQAEQKLYEIQQNTSDDCVSRSDVMALIEITNLKHLSVIRGISQKAFEDLLNGAQTLSPVTPTFPEGVTNGDVIKTIFPDIKIHEHEKTDICDAYIQIDIWDFSIYVSKDFWDAPYKKGDDDGRN